MKRNGKLHNLRATLGYTQVQFANILGVPRTQITMYETGERLPSVLFCLKLKETFNLSYEWIGEFVCEIAKQRNAGKND